MPGFPMNESVVTTIGKHHQAIVVSGSRMNSTSVYQYSPTAALVLVNTAIATTYCLCPMVVTFITPATNVLVIG